MRFSLTSLVRLLAFCSLAFSMISIGISRLVSQPPPLNEDVAPRYYGIQGAVFDPPEFRPFVMDARTGELDPAELPPGLTMEYALSAPWRPADGRVVLAGRLAIRSGIGSSATFEGGSLALLDMASGGVLEESRFDPVISGRPCWLPGEPRRLLFPAGDGRLYLMDIHSKENMISASAEPPATPRPLRWACEPPGVKPPLLNDPAALPDGRLVVSLSKIEREDGHFVLSALELWWLEVDLDRESIVKAGRLTPDGGDRDERLPNACHSADGRDFLAYLSRPRRRGAWDLRLANLKRDPATGHHVWNEREMAIIGQDVAVTTPVFSTDGKRLFRVGRKPGKHGRVNPVELSSMFREGLRIATGEANR